MVYLDVFGLSVFVIGIAILTSITLFASVLAHEFGHSLVARKYNIKISSIKLFLFGGVSDIAEEPPSPKAEFFIAITGPLISLVIGAAFFTAAFFVQSLWLMVFFYILGLTNIFLTGFNLLPGYPLDGGRVLRSILWWLSGDLLMSTKYASVAGQIVAVLLGVLGIIEAIYLNLVGGLWLVVISLFLYWLARSSVNQTLIYLLLKDKTAGEIARNNFSRVDANIPIPDLINQSFEERRLIYLVMDNYQPMGIIDIRNIDLKNDQNKNAGEIATPFAKIPQVDSNEKILPKLPEIDQNNGSLLAVFSNNNFVGTISKEDIRYLIIKSKIDKSAG